MYAAKITINYKPEKIRYFREVKLPHGLLTLEDIAKHLEEGEKFYFFQREEGSLSLPVDYLGIQGERLETKEEMELRIAKQKKYMENYKKHHAKYNTRKKD